MTIFENNEIKLEKFISGSLGNNSYLISSKKDSNSIVIDVPDKPDSYFLLKNLSKISGVNSSVFLLPNSLPI